MRNTAIYIDTANSYLETASYERIELFDFETIDVTSTIQDLKDIGEVFTDYSKEFVAPASKMNNRTFSHFYKNSITNGFDARIKHRAYITLNGLVHRNGFIRLVGVDEENGRPKQYRLTFFGAMSNLKDILGDDELSSLSGQLINYTHDYDRDTIYDGFTDGLVYSGGSMIKDTLGVRDVVYPAISSDYLWYYDSSSASAPDVTNKESNLYGSGANDKGVDWLSLKPAIKVSHIITAIEDKYDSVDFSNDYFADADFNELYLLLHKNKGTVNGGESVRILDFATEFSYDSGDDGDKRPIVTKTFDEAGFEDLTHTYDLSFFVTAATSVDYNAKIKDSQGNVLVSLDLSGTAEQEISYIFSSDVEQEWEVFVEINSDSLANFSIRAEMDKIEEFINYTDDKPFIDSVTYSGVFSSIGSPYSMTSTIYIGEQMPKMKTIDFLRGLFKAFNLVPYVDDDGVIVVDTLNDFYDLGNEIDISRYIVTESRVVDRMDLYSTINFEYVKPKTFGIIKQNELQQDDYGNLEYNGGSNGVFDGGKYTLKVPFERVLYSRISDEDTGATNILTPFSWSWLVDKDENETITSPILFYNINTSIDTSKWNVAFVSKTLAISKYNRASSLSNSQNTSLNFENAYDEYENEQFPNANLFDKYYSDYVGNIYDKTSRIIKQRAYLPLSIITSFKMNDVFIINDIKYKINEITINLNTGESDMELITNY